MVTDLVIQPSSSVGRISGDMKNQFLFFVAIGLLPALPVFGHSEELDFHYWYSDTLPLPEGWTHYKLNKGALDGDWKGGAYFKYNEMGWLQSPVFSSSIRSVTLSVATTASDPSRRLHLHPIVDGVVMEPGKEVLPTESRTYAEQVFQFGGCRANQFILKFSGPGNKGNWGMERIVVRYGDDSTDDEEIPPRSWSIADVARKPGFRAADFSMLQYVNSGVDTPWKNGVSIDGFHAFAGVTPCGDIHLATNFNPRAFGLYALGVTDGETSTRVLTMKGTSGSSMSLVLPIALDAKRKIARLSIAYRVWAPTEADASILSFSCQALDGLAQMNAGESGWFVPPSLGGGGGMRSFEVPTASLRDWKFVSFRWSLPQEANLSAIGISDVRVSAELEPSGFAVIVK